MVWQLNFIHAFIFTFKSQISRVHLPQLKKNQTSTIALKRERQSLLNLISISQNPFQTIFLKVADLKYTTIIKLFNMLKFYTNQTKTNISQSTEKVQSERRCQKTKSKRFKLTYKPDYTVQVCTVWVQEKVSVYTYS